MATELAKAYVQIVPSADGISDGISSILSGSDVTSSAKNSGSSIGKSIVGGITASLAAGATAVAGAAASLWSGLQSTAAVGDEIDKTSQKIGMSTDAYQKWDYVMNLAGTSMADCTTGMKTLTNQIGNALEGSDAAAENFSKLGLSVDDLNSMSREDAFSAVIAGLQGMEDSTERAALANDLFGKSGQNLTPLFNMTNEETLAAMQNLEDLGGVMSSDAVSASASFQDSLTTLNAAISGTKNSIMADFLPGVTSVVEGLTMLFKGEDGAEMISEGLNSITESFKESIPTMVDALKSMLPILLETAVDILTTLAEGLIEALPELMPAAMDIINSLVQDIISFLPTIIECGMQLLLQLVDGIAVALPQMIPQIVDVVLTITDTLIDHLPEIIEAALKIIIALGEGLIKALPKLIAKAPEIISSIAKSLTSSLQTIRNVGKDLITGLWNGISDKIQWIKDKIAGFGSTVISSIKGIFGIHSPSTIMRDEVGKFLAEGIAVGIEANTDAVDSAIEDLTSGTITSGINGVMDSTVNASVNNDSVIDLLKEYLPQLANKQIYLDSGALVGATASKMDAALGRITTSKGRSVSFA